MHIATYTIVQKQNKATATNTIATEIMRNSRQKWYLIQYEINHMCAEAANEKEEENNMKMSNNDKDNYQAVTIVCDNITHTKQQSYQQKQTNKQKTIEK